MREEREGKMGGRVRYGKTQERRPEEGEAGRKHRRSHGGNPLASSAPVGSSPLQSLPSCPLPLALGPTD